MNCCGFIRTKFVYGRYKRVIEIPARGVVEEIFNCVNAEFFKLPSKKRPDLRQIDNGRIQIHELYYNRFTKTSRSEDEVNLVPR